MLLPKTQVKENPKDSVIAAVSKGTFRAYVCVYVYHFVAFLSRRRRAPLIHAENANLLYIIENLFVLCVCEKRE